MKDWINDLNTTNVRILASVAGAVVNITAIMFAILVLKWEPTAMQLKVLTGCAGVLLTMMGFDVIQFIGKRFSDSGYAAAKSGPSPVNVEAPSSVTVTPATPEEPAAVSVAPVPTPEAGRDPSTKLAGE
ncbi:MAG: hypothetical protein ABJA80_04055 [bacterium]